jgi:hypothetical protein
MEKISYENTNETVREYIEIAFEKIRKWNNTACPTRQQELSS